MSAKRANIEKALKNAGNRLLLEARINLDRGRKKDTGRLRRSLGIQIDDDGENFTIALLAADYARYIDRGRGDTQAGGTKPGKLRKSIEGWVQRNRYRLKGRRGQFGGLKPYQVRSLAYVISRKIHNIGFVGIEFITDAFKTTEPYITQAISESYKLDLQREIERILNDKTNG